MISVMIRPKCNSIMNVVNVEVFEAKSKAKSFQCTECDYFEFEPISSKKVVDELHMNSLKSQ